MKEIKGVIFKNCARFTKCISRINNTNRDNAQDIGIVMPMYTLIEHNITESEWFKSKIKIARKTPAAGNTKDVEITVPLKYLSNFWRTLEMPLINCEVNLIFIWWPTCVVSSATREAKFKITETRLYVLVVTLSAEDNAKFLQQLKSGFKRTINWNKYESDLKTFAQNRYLNHLINPSFQGVNRLFVLSFENENDRTSHSTYYLPKVEIKDYNVMIDGKNFFD